MRCAGGPRLWSQGRSWVQPNPPVTCVHRCALTNDIVDCSAYEPRTKTNSQQNEEHSPSNISHRVSPYKCVQVLPCFMREICDQPMPYALASWLMERLSILISATCCAVNLARP